MKAVLSGEGRGGHPLGLHQAKLPLLVSSRC